MRKALVVLATTLLASSIGLVSGGSSAYAETKPTSGVAAAPTAAQLKEAVKNCTKQISNGKYTERGDGARTVPICKTKNAIHWRSGMTIDCDGQVTNNCNKSADPDFQPETRWQQSNGKHLIADKLPFIVVPGPSSIWKFADYGLTGGTVVAVVYKEKVAYAVVGDEGPKQQAGEGSYALANRLGINPNPRSGGVSGRVVDYIVFPGARSKPIEDNSSATSLGQTAAGELVSGAKSCLTTQTNRTSYPNLSAGSTDESVAAAQCELSSNGYRNADTRPTGTFDASTVAAVKKLQSSVGLPVTGALDKHTWTALLSAGSTPTIQNGSSGEDVNRLQQALNAATGAKLAIDGQYRGMYSTQNTPKSNATTDSYERTLAAVRNFQRSHGLTVNGVVDTTMWKALQAGK